MTEHAAGVKTSRLTHLVEHVRADPDLTPDERTTSIQWTGRDDHAHVYTEERGVMLSLLRSPIARIHKLRVSDTERFGARVHPDQYENGDVTGVTATVPIGAVLIKSDARSTTRRSLIVSDYQGGDDA